MVSEIEKTAAVTTMFTFYSIILVNVLTPSAFQAWQINDIQNQPTLVNRD